MIDNLFEVISEWLDWDSKKQIPIDRNIFIICG